MGKTSLVLNPKPALMERMVSSEARVDVARLRRGRNNSNERLRLIAARRDIAAAHLFIEDAAAETRART